MATQKITNEQIKLIHLKHLTGINLEELGKELGVTRATLRKRMIKLNLKIEKFFTNSNSIRNALVELNSDKAYMLGFISADGSIVNNYLCLEIHKKDIEVLELFRNIFCPNNKFTINRNCLRIAAYSTHLIKDLNNFGIIQNKSKIPFSINLDIKWYPDFIRGFIDGDGYVDSNCVKFHNTSYPLLLQIKEYLNNLGIITSKIYNASEKNLIVYCLQVKTKSSLEKMANIIWYNNSFCLKRKDLRQYRANFIDKRYKAV